MHLLVIEDDDDVSLLYRLVVEAAGHTLEVVTEGRLGAELATAGRFDLVVLDGMLPDLDGLQVLALLRADPRSAGLPVVMASARSGSSDRESGLAAGADAYLVKPFDPQLLLQTAAGLVGADAPARPSRPVTAARPTSAPPRAEAPPAPAPAPANELAPLDMSDTPLANILSLAFDAIVSIDAAQRIVSFNKGAERVFGYLAEEVIGKPLDMLIPKRFRTAHESHVQGFADGHNSGRLMGNRFVYGVRRDGSEFPAEASITKLEINGRNVFTAIVRDATERMRAEADLLARAEQQAAVADLGLRAITTPDLASLLDDAVTTLARVLGVDLVKLGLVEMGSNELFLQAGTGWRAGSVDELRLDASAGTLVGYSLDVDEPVLFNDIYDDPRFRPDDLLVSHSVRSGIHVPLKGRTRSLGLIGVYTRHGRTFTTDEVHVAQAIANVVASGVQRDADERRVRTFLDAAPDATLVVDPAGRIISANAQAEELFGYTRDELHRLGVDALVPGDARHAHAAHRHSFERDRKPRAMGEGLELTALRRDGTEVPVDIMLRPFSTEEGSFTVAAVRDITDRRRSEATRDAFLHAVSHELRTPLTAVLGFSGLLRDQFASQLPPTGADLVDRIQSAAGRLNRLLTDLLDLDRLGRGVLEAQRREVELAPIVQRATEGISHDSHVLVTSITPTGLRANVDEAQLERIIENLVVNAVRHTPAGSTIEVRIAPSTNGVLLQVDDNGKGVPADIRDQIFQPFNRGTTTFTPGTGIGLSLVARFADLHGGRAWVEESPSGGASFRVVLGS